MRLGQVIFLSVALVLIAGCARPEDRLLGVWHGSAEIKRPPSGNAKLDEDLSKLHTKADYTLTLERGGIYQEAVGNHKISGSWMLAGQVLTLTPKTVDGANPAKARADAEQMMSKLQISLPLPEGTEGPRSATVSQDFNSIRMPSVGVTVELRKGGES